MTSTNQPEHSAQKLRPLPELTERHFQPSRRDASEIGRSVKLGERNSSQQPRSLKAFREQYDRIQGSRLA